MVSGVSAMQSAGEWAVPLDAASSRRSAVRSQAEKAPARRAHRRSVLRGFRRLTNTWWRRCPRRYGMPMNSRSNTPSAYAEQSSWTWSARRNATAGGDVRQARQKRMESQSSRSGRYTSGSACGGRRSRRIPPRRSRRTQSAATVVIASHGTRSMATEQHRLKGRPSGVRMPRRPRAS